MITSSHNPKIQKIRQLLNRRKERTASETFVVEGVRLLEEAFLAGWEPESVFFCEGLSDRGKQLIEKFKGFQVNIEEVKSEILNQVSNTENSQGILALIKKRELLLPHDLNFVLLIDKLRDPGNLGSILRAASAAGVQAAILTPGTTDAFSPKVLRAGMGAQFRLPVRSLNWQQIDELLQPSGKDVLEYYLASSYARINYWQVDFRQPSVIIIGGEADGASKEAARRSKTQLTIPMPGASESLNAAVAAGILLFEVVRQRNGN